MIVGFVDVVRSTDAAEREGFRATLRLREQLRELSEILGTVGPPVAPRFLGERQGDGFVFAAPREMALMYLKEVVKLQMTTWMHADWSPMRLSLGVGVGSWDGPPWVPGSTFNGRDVTTIARLLEQCRPGGVAVNRELHGLMWEHAPELRAMFCETVAALPGFETPETFWVLRDRRRRRGMESRMVGVVTVVALVLLAATTMGTWRAAIQAEAQYRDTMTWRGAVGATLAASTRSQEQLEGAIQALVWTLCETSDPCRGRNTDEPPYLKMLRDKARRSRGAGER